MSYRLLVINNLVKCTQLNKAMKIDESIKTKDTAINFAVSFS